MCRLNTDEMVSLALHRLAFIVRNGNETAAGNATDHTITSVPTVMRCSLLRVVIYSAVCWCLCSVGTHGTSVNGVGFDTAIPPQIPPAPYDETPFDTTLVSVRAPREARLKCMESAPLFRLVQCDIITYDNCGNLYGRRGNITDWIPAATHVVSGAASAHVSPVMFLTNAVARFYFTPTAVGVYRVTVSRSPTSRLPALMTPLPLQQLVVVHNTISRCTPLTITNENEQLSRLQWTYAHWHNEAPSSIPGLRGLRKSTNIVTDTAWIYPLPDNVVQTSARRAPLQPAVLSTIGDPLTSGLDNYNYCDVIQQG